MILSSFASYLSNDSISFISLVLCFNSGIFSALIFPTFSPSFFLLSSCVLQTHDNISDYPIIIISHPYPTSYHILCLSYHAYQTGPIQCTHDKRDDNILSYNMFGAHLHNHPNNIQINHRTQH